MTRFFQHSLLALAVSALACGAAVAGPAAALPKDLPAYAADKPLPVPDIGRKTLANGLEVWVVPRDGIPRVDYVLAVRNAGYAADAADAPGFAALLAGLLAEGTAQRDSRQIAEFAQAQGGGVGASVNSDGALVYGNALAANAGPMLSLLAEVARTPAFPESEVRLAQANALQALKAAEAQPGFRANRALLSAVYGEHPYARTQQTEASITAVTPAVLRSEHQRRFHPDRSLLVVAGRIDADTAFALAEQAFGDWAASGAEVAPTAAAPRDARPQRLLLQRDGSVQSTLRLASPAVAATDPDAIPLQLAGTVLGGSFSSRVMQNLREEKGYTYGARAGASTSAQGGHVSGAADVRNEVTGAALTEFFKEYARIGSEPVPATELDDTKRYVAGGYLIGNQMQAAVAATLAGNWLVGLPPEYLGEFVPRVRAVDAAQVQAMAAKYFAPERQSIIVVGDGGSVADQLADWGEFTTLK
ncbi:pitrilysin family protein [Luteimonas sp. MC1895]|uniref:M16 family metallopeptidase n=1 Tax=Luteimonas sp. MC1895 TaxID=2819513 RepID=UPI0018F09340|nr:pitrilysin family protein [Luteimonas sp. MC1895]MBJ6980012.1 insulinase family protein [Luteimonas sp. MC1895]